MHCFAWLDSYCPDFDRLLVSARRFDVDVQPIGLEADWTNWSPGMTKNSTLYEALKPLADDEVVLATDAHDVLYFAGEQRILDTFQRLKAPIVFGAESRCYHMDLATKAQFPPAGKYRYRYLNSGTIIGYAGPLRAMLEEIVTYHLGPKGNDQTAHGMYFVRNPGAVSLDYHCELFWCVGGEWNFFRRRARVTPGRIFNKMTRTSPCILHVPWPRKRHLLLAVAEQAGFTAKLDRPNKIG